MEIKLNVKRNGMMIGSCGWVSERLSTAEVEIKGNALFVTYTNGKDKDGNPKKVRKPICGVVDATDWAAYARTTGDWDGYWYAYPYDRDLGIREAKYTLFDCVLTDAAESIADDFIKKCLDAFRDAWENDKEEACDE